jgi:archaellum component FlaC
MDIKNAEKVFSNKQIIPTIEKVEESAKSWTRKKRVILVDNTNLSIFNIATGKDLMTRLADMDQLVGFTLKLFENELPKHISLVASWVGEVAKKGTYNGSQSFLNRINDHHKAISKTYSDIEKRLFRGTTDRGQDSYDEQFFKERENANINSFDPIQEVLFYFPNVLIFPSPQDYQRSRKTIIDGIVIAKEDIKGIKETVERILKNYETISKILDTIEIKLESTFKLFDRQLEGFMKFYEGKEKLSLEARAFKLAIACNIDEPVLFDSFRSILYSAFVHNFIFLSKAVTETVTLVKHSDSFIFSAKV